MISCNKRGATDYKTVAPRNLTLASAGEIPNPQKWAANERHPECKNIHRISAVRHYSHAFLWKTHIKWSQLIFHPTYCITSFFLRTLKLERILGLSFWIADHRRRGMIRLLDRCCRMFLPREMHSIFSLNIRRTDIEAGWSYKNYSCLAPHWCPAPCHILTRTSPFSPTQKQDAL